MPQKSLSCLQQATFLFVCTKLKSFDCFDFYAIEEKIVQMHIDVLNISKRGWWITHKTVSLPCSATALKDFNTDKLDVLSRPLKPKNECSNTA